MGNANGSVPLRPATPGRRRETYVGSPGFFLLNQACVAVNAAFDTTCFLVGSAASFPTWRDVDVRAILPDEQFARLFPGINAQPRLHPFWSLVCSSTSLWLGQATGLPVDFQVQSHTVSCQYQGNPRVPLGLFMAGGESA